MNESRVEGSPFGGFDPDDEYAVKQLAEAVCFDEAYASDVRRLMRRYCDIIASGGTPNAYVLGFIAEAFNRHLERQTDIAECFGLQKRGRPADRRTEDRDKRAAYLALKEHIQKSVGIEFAKSAAQSRCHISRTQMQKAWSKWKRDAAFQLVEEIEDGSLRIALPARGRLVRFIDGLPGRVMQMRMVQGRDRWYPKPRWA